MICWLASGMDDAAMAVTVQAHTSVTPSVSIQYFGELAVVCGIATPVPIGKSRLDDRLTVIVKAPVVQLPISH